MTYRSRVTYFFCGADDVEVDAVDPDEYVRGFVDSVYACLLCCCAAECERPLFHVLVPGGLDEVDDDVVAAGLLEVLDEEPDENFGTLLDDVAGFEEDEPDEKVGLLPLLGIDDDGREEDPDEKLLDGLDDDPLENERPLEDVDDRPPDDEEPEEAPLPANDRSGKAIATKSASTSKRFMMNS